MASTGSLRPPSSSRPVIAPATPSCSCSPAGEVQEYVENDDAAQDLRAFVRLVDAHGPETIIKAGGAVRCSSAARRNSMIFLAGAVASLVMSCACDRLLYEVTCH